jgi:hypothetical protein
MQTKWWQHLNKNIIIMSDNRTTTIKHLKFVSFQNWPCTCNFSCSNECFLFKSRAQFVAGNSFWRGRLSTVDLLVMISNFVKMKKKFCIISNWFKLVSTRRSVVLLILPFRLGFPGCGSLLRWRRRLREMEQFVGKNWN